MRRLWLAVALGAVLGGCFDPLPTETDYCGDAGLAGCTYDDPVGGNDAGSNDAGSSDAGLRVFASTGSPAEVPAGLTTDVTFSVVGDPSLLSDAGYALHVDGGVAAVALVGLDAGFAQLRFVVPGGVSRGLTELGISTGYGPVSVPVDVTAVIVDGTAAAGAERGTPSQPFRDLTSALAAVGPSSTIQIRSSMVTHAGYPISTTAMTASGVTVESLGAGRARVQGPGATSTTAAFVSASELHLRRLTIDGFDVALAARQTGVIHGLDLTFGLNDIHIQADEWGRVYLDGGVFAPSASDTVRIFEDAGVALRNVFISGPNGANSTIVDLQNSGWIEIVDSTLLASDDAPALLVTENTGARVVISNSMIDAGSSAVQIEGDATSATPAALWAVASTFLCHGSISAATQQCVRLDHARGMLEGVTVRTLSSANAQDGVEMRGNFDGGALTLRATDGGVPTQISVAGASKVCFVEHRRTGEGPDAVIQQGTLCNGLSFPDGGGDCDGGLPPFYEASSGRAGCYQTLP